MRVISLNANGIRSAARKGFFTWLQTMNADMVCIQETKAHCSQLDETFFPLGYTCQYVDAQKKGYSGVAIYSRLAPISTMASLEFEISNDEGRYLQFDFDNNLSLISIYLPSGTSGDARQAIKYQYLDYLNAHLVNLKNSGREFIICGDLNIAHTKLDIKNWRGNQKNSGFLPEERAWMDALFSELGFVDAFRIINQEPEQYTWWSNRGQAWANNVGWRIDYQVITPGLTDKVHAAHIYKDQRFSDHAPLIIDYKE